MLNVEVSKLINEQINKEMFSAYLYLEFANYYIDQNLNGFGNWFNVQAKEELDHAMLFMQYLQNNSEGVQLKAISAPDKSFNTIEQPLKESLEHEQFISASINNIYAVALEQKEFKTLQFLDWFIKEQVEEEKNADELIKKYNMFGKDGKGLYLLDTELAARVYAAPTLVL